ncbi:MAG: DUF2442 domain-containing protein [Chloroflexi bacterium]|nr:MAG: DUF2442 domain-containing protein [Chloroflexota bacterium]
MERHQLFRVTKFKVVDDYTLRIRFDDGSEQTIDFLPVLYGPVFGPLRDKKLFAQVQLIAYAGCLEWPNGADFDPETLRNWPLYKDAIIANRQMFLEPVI